MRTNWLGVHSPAKKISYDQIEHPLPPSLNVTEPMVFYMDLNGIEHWIEIKRTTHSKILKLRVTNQGPVMI